MKIQSIRVIPEPMRYKRKPPKPDFNGLKVTDEEVKKPSVLRDPIPIYWLV